MECWNKTLTFTGSWLPKNLLWEDKQPRSNFCQFCDCNSSYFNICKRTNCTDTKNERNKMQISVSCDNMLFTNSRMKMKLILFIFMRLKSCVQVWMYLCFCFGHNQEKENDMVKMLQYSRLRLMYSSCCNNNHSGGWRKVERC